MTTADNPQCVRCKHDASDHTLDDSLNISPTDPDAPFRCTWPVKHERMGAQILCDCPDFIVPPDAGWPYNDEPDQPSGRAVDDEAERAHYAALGAQQARGERP